MFVVTVDDLKSRWPGLPPGGEEQAKTLLADAVTILESQVSSVEAANQDALVMVACQMVRRALSTPAGVPEGVTSVSQTVGPFATQMGFSSNTGALYLTKAEKKLLGIGAQRAGSVDMLGGFL